MTQSVGSHQEEPPSPNQVIRPADFLEGKDLPGGWKVIERLDRSHDATGSSFSTPYHVQRTDDHGNVHIGFLKALDLTVALTMQMPIVDALQILSAAYVFERDLVTKCSTARMSNVRIGIDAGAVTVDDPAAHPILASVPYIIFERAEGDVRALVSKKLTLFDESWTFRVLHGVANGLRQLHQAGVAHQDLKPSNVLSVRGTAKLGDLGRAAMRDGTGLFHDHIFAGDFVYAPPECLYGENHADHWTRHRASDTYQLGSMLVFLFTGAGMTPLIEEQLPSAFHWRTWPRDYRNALPYVRAAFDNVVENFETLVPERLRSETQRLVRELCEPDPLLRGDSRGGSGARQYSMERYVSVFDRLAKTAEIELRHQLTR